MTRLETTIFKIPIGVSGTLAITSRPRGADWLHGDIAALAAEGVGVLVSLLGTDEQLELGLRVRLGRVRPTTSNSWRCRFRILEFRSIRLNLCRRSKVWLHCFGTEST
jgi:hypothetical protein